MSRSGAGQRALPWLIVLCLMMAVTCETVEMAFARYRELRTGWSWDLAYYNQWFWALTKGDGQITVRPLASYAEEGPSVWKMNYLTPVRFLIAPVYRLDPRPTTLLIIHCVVFWLCIPAAFGLARCESGSDWVGVSAALLVPLTPLLGPLALNDFRELQLALPFGLWAVGGVRARHRGLAALGVGGLLACRQEFGLVVASLAILPGREPEDAGRAYAWARALLVVGLGWFLFAFLGYLKLAVGSYAPAHYLDEFGGPKAGLGETIQTAGEFLLVGMGAWAFLALASPRATLLAFPWAWSLSSGRWALRLIGTEQWHHVRYAAPMAMMTLAAGLVGYGTLARRLSGKKRGLWLIAAAWALSAVVMIAETRQLHGWYRQVPRPIAPEEAAEFWRWAGQVGPEDGVLAVYDVTAPLSSRKVLYSYILDANKPRGYPAMPPEVGWVFLRNGDLAPAILTDQGFEIVHHGPFLTIFRRKAGRTGGARR